jgi:hypothetical protein
MEQVKHIWFKKKRLFHFKMKKRERVIKLRLYIYIKKNIKQSKTVFLIYFHFKINKLAKIKE